MDHDVPSETMPYPASNLVENVEVCGTDGQQVDVARNLGVSLERGPR